MRSHPAEGYDLVARTGGHAVTSPDTSVTSPRLDPAQGVIRQVASSDRISGDDEVQPAENVLLQEDEIEAQARAPDQAAGSDREASGRRGCSSRLSLLVQP